MPKIFISYRREDSKHAVGRLHSALKRHVHNPKQDIFIDIDNIPNGVDFVEHLDLQVAQCDAMLVVIGPAWISIRDTRTGERRLDDPNDFVRIEVASTQVTADRIEQGLYYVDTKDKKSLLIDMLNNDEEMKRVIVFTRTKHGADRITEQLMKAGVDTDVIHGDKSQNARQRSLDNFRTGRVRVLVATDIAARGIEVNNITHVVNFELPPEAESYVHRIGRTARAGSEGPAIAFCDSSERNFLRDIERLIKVKMNVLGGDMRDLIHMEPVGKGGGGRRGGQGFGGQGQGFGGQNRSPRSGDGAQRSSRPPMAGGGGRSEGRPENGRFEGRSESRPEGRFEGARQDGPRQDGPRQDGRFNARPDGRFEGRSENRSEGRFEGRRDSAPRSDNRFDGRPDARPAHQGGFRGERSEAPRGGAPGRDSRGKSPNRSNDQGFSGRRDNNAAPRRRQNNAA